MPVDAPDGTLQMQRIEIVGSEAVPEQATQETAIAATEGKVADATATYQTLATWTVSADSIGILRSIEFAAGDYELARFRLTIGGSVKFADVELPDALTLYFADTRLVAAAVVLVEGKSTSATSVDMWAMIEGKEVA